MILPHGETPMTQSPHVTRRRFLGTTAGVAGAMMFMPHAKVRGANDRLRVAVVGCGGQGRGHVGRFAGTDGVQIVAVCDPDLTLMDRAVEDRDGIAKVQDYRKLLEDDSIDAVVLATPNHWHALGTIMACQA